MKNYNVTLTYNDGTTETYAVLAKSLLAVTDELFKINPHTVNAIYRETEEVTQ